MLLDKWKHLIVLKEWAHLPSLTSYDDLHFVRVLTHDRLHGRSQYHDKILRADGPPHLVPYYY